MKKTLLIFIFSSLIHTSKSQIKALTENGREVILHENGTWNYASNNENDPLNNNDSMSTNSHDFFKPAAATFLVKSNRLNMGIYINPAKWTFTAHKENQVNPEYLFELKSGQGGAMIISEKIEIPLLNLKAIALTNALSAAPDAKILSAEYRNVNNQRVLCMKLSGTIQGMKFIYFGYYYSNANGTVQLVTYSGENMFEESRNELENFLNGFTVIK